MRLLKLAAHPFFGAVLFLALTALDARAGVIFMLSGAPAVQGKLSVTATGVRGEGDSSQEVPWDDLLECDFGDEAFDLPYFKSLGDKTNQLPADWKTQAIGPADPSGSATYAAGVLTLKGDGCDYQAAQADHYYFAGCPWTGDGQWTCYLSETSGEVGITLRETLEAGSPMIAAGVGSEGGGMIHYGAAYKGIGGRFPTWLRLTRVAGCLDITESADKENWQVISQDTWSAKKYWAGFVINSRQGAKQAQAVITNITFTPAPAELEALPPGVLLKSGSFLAGPIFFLSNSDGALTHLNKNIPVKPGQVAAVIYHQSTVRELKAAPTPGMIYRNGDFLASDVELLQGGMVQMSSVALGLSSYYLDTVRAIVVNPVAPMASAFEVRLHDGSILRASGIGMVKGQLTVHEVNGLDIPIDAAELAQVRAGQTLVQPLMGLPWTTAGSLKVPAPAKAPTNVLAASDTPANPTASQLETEDQVPPVTTWEGPDCAQMFVLSAAVPVAFPLSGKFAEFATQVVVAPGAPSDAQVTLHVLAGGKEIGSSPPMKPGEPPRPLRVKLDEPRAITLRVDSTPPGARLVVMDPVAIRTAAKK